jgi:hypothetical protein
MVDQEENDMIEFFDTYVRTKDGFVAVKGDLVAICDKRGLMGHTYQACIYRNRQTHTRAIYYIGQSSRRWVREATVTVMRKFHEQRQTD